MWMWRWFSGDGGHASSLLNIVAQGEEVIDVEHDELIEDGVAE